MYALHLMLVTKPESGMQPKITASENRAVNKDFLFENSLCVIFPFPVHFVYKLSISAAVILFIGESVKYFV